MQRKRIAHIISSLKIGGAESWLIDLLDHLPNEYEHHVLYFHEGPNKNLLEKRGINTYQLKPQFYNPLFYKRAYQLMRHLNPDLIHSSLWAGNLVGRICARLLKKPIISTIHLGLDEDGSIRNMFDRYTFHYANHIVAVSEVVGKTIHERSAWLKHRPFSIIKNGISPALPEARISRQELGIEADAFVIGSVGRFIARKNYRWLIECFADLHRLQPSTHLLILGLGPEEDSIRQRITELGLGHAVTLVVGKQAVPYYPLMDLFIQPSKQEGLSIALLEAMRAKLPCIATSSDGRHDALVNNENGIIIPLEKEAVVAACSRLITDAFQRERLANRAQESLIKDYSSMSMAKHYQELYTHYINTNP